MAVNSFSFFLFFAIIFGSYYGVCKHTVKVQNVILLLSSYVAYGIASLEMLSLLFVCTLSFYCLGYYIKKNNVYHPKRASILTTIGVGIGVGILFYFKYLNFFIESFCSFLNVFGLKENISSIKIIVPLGVSFFIFRLISYLVDIRKGYVHPPSFVDFAVYISFFPCILSGPIDRSSEFLPQLSKYRPFRYELAVEGCRQILWGMFKKMVVADGLSLFINKDIEVSTGSTLAIVAVMYSIQIYADFSGYSDMAIGVGKLLGIRITRNFHYPYFSRSVSEFWNRWHMSLLTWFRYYIYYPLGGSRCSKAKVIRNTFVVFLISGLWHGANWTFIVWGLFHAVLFLPLLMGRKIRYKEYTPYRLSDIFRIVGVFFLVTTGWIIFRCTSILESWYYIIKIFSPSLFSKPQGVMWALPSMIFATVMFVFEWIWRKEEFPLKYISEHKAVRWCCYVSLILAIIFYQGKPAEFIYFKF